MATTTTPQTTTASDPYASLGLGGAISSSLNAVPNPINTIASSADSTFTGQSNLPISAASPTKIVSGSNGVRQSIAVTQQKAQALSNTIANKQQQFAATVGTDGQLQVNGTTVNKTPLAPGSSSDSSSSGSSGNGSNTGLNYVVNPKTGYNITGGSYQTKDANGNTITIDAQGNVVTNGSTGIPGATVTQPGATGSTTGTSGSSVQSVLDAATKAIAALTGSTDPASQTAAAAVQSAQQSLLNAQQGNYTTAEQAQIQAAADQTIAQYQPLIDAAQTAKDQGMPKAVVQAGELGGFLNTQYAGRSAVTPSDAGFVGTGGQLEQIKSAYDDNIQQITSQRDAAVSQAKIAAQQAIQTGDQQDFANAQTLYQNAVSAYQTNISNLNTMFSTAFQAAQIPGILASQAATTQATQLDTATSLAAGVIAVDPATGMPTMPSAQQIQAFATANNIPLATAQAAINTAYQGSLKNSATIQKMQLGSGTIAEYNTWAQQQQAAGKTPTIDDFFASKASDAKQGEQLPADVVSGMAKLVEQGDTSALTTLGSMGGTAAKQQVWGQVFDDIKSGDFTGDLASQQALYKAYSSQANSIATQAGLNDKAVTQAMSQIDIVRNAFSKLNNSQIQGINQALNAGTTQIGDPAANNALQAINTLANEYGKAVSGSLGISGVNVKSQDEIQKFINTNLSPGQISSILTQITTELNNSKKAYTSAISDTKDNITALNNVDTSGGGSGGSGDSGSGDVLSSPLNSWAAATQ